MKSQPRSWLFYFSTAHNLKQASFLLFVGGWGILPNVGKINPDQSQEGVYDD
jgi:hypothetical protein